MTTAASLNVLNRQQIEMFQRDGFLIVRGVIPVAEIDAIRDRFQKLAAEGKRIPGLWNPEPDSDSDPDPLKRYPRVMMAHRFDDSILGYLLDKRILDILRDLLGEEPLAAQSMYYFKPPGARGQAFHQDDYYLQTQNGACLAAWIAIDPSTRHNGGLQVIPGTHKMEIQCPEESDSTESFYKDLVRPPPGVEPVWAELQPGDILFFGGRVVHGSRPNSSKTMWRQTLINHYVPRSAAAVSQSYFPLLDARGNNAEMGVTAGGGPCGTEAKSTYAP